MTDNISQQVAQWLINDCRADYAKPISMQIKSTVYYGAYYEQTRQPLPGAKSQEPYTQKAFYLLGPLPYCYRHTPRKTVFDVNWPGNRFYVGSYSTPECLEEPYKKYHPFGLSFQLMPDDYGVTDQERRNVVETIIV